MCHWMRLNVSVMSTRQHDGEDGFGGYGEVKHQYDGEDQQNSYCSIE